MTKQDLIDYDKKKWYPAPGSLNRDEFPMCGNLSGALWFRLIPSPMERKKPEFLYVKIPPSGKKHNEAFGFIGQWNFAWEAAQLRTSMFKQREIPSDFKWLEKYEDENIYLIPYCTNQNFYAHRHLLSLLPAKTREKFGLPRQARELWPMNTTERHINELLPKGYDAILSQAFAYHIWPLINNGSRLNRFSKSEPISILAHNLNYWAPFLNEIIEEKMLESPMAEFENEKDRKDAIRANKKMPKGITVNRPRQGNYVWWGEDEAWQVTNNLIETADKKGQLRNIIDAVKSNRIEDDFSSLWSYEKEDFERKLYRKRNKIKVVFTELDNAPPIHSPSSEIHDKLIWEDFMTILDKKERRVVVCLKNGITNLAEIGKELGYQNHSPVSKTLKKIRNKASEFL